MPYAGHQTVQLDIQIGLSGQTAHCTLEYGTLTTEYVSPQNFAQEWDAQVSAALIAILSGDAQFIGVEFKTTAPVGVPPFAPYFLVKGDQGGTLSEALPPHNALRLYKVPDNSLIEGALNDPFRIGMIRLMGIPESAQKNGFLNDAYLAGVNALGEFLENLTVDYASFTDVPYDLLMIRRNAAMTQQGIAPVLDTYAGGIIGSQDSRKIGT